MNTYGSRKLLCSNWNANCTADPTRFDASFKHHALITLRITTALVLCILLSPSTSYSDTRTPIIVTTTGMLGDTIRNLVQEHAHVQHLMRSGVDPHMYKPTRDNIASLLKADLIFLNGLKLEGRFAHALERIQKVKQNVIAVGDLLNPLLLHAPEEYTKAYDPHIWMDPILWKEVTRIISDSLITHFPNMESVIRKNTNDYLSQLDELNAFASESIRLIPERKRVLVTAHDAFHYFGIRYRIRVIGIQGISTESEAGIRDIKGIVSQLIEREVPAVFIESTVSDRNVRAIREGSEAQGHTVQLGGTLFSDAMGEEGTPEGTYIGMIKHNITTFVTAMRKEPNQSHKEDLS